MESSKGCYGRGIGLGQRRSQGHLESDWAPRLRIVIDRSGGEETTSRFAAEIISGSALGELAVWVEVLESDIARLELEADAPG